MRWSNDQSARAPRRVKRRSPLLVRRLLCCVALVSIFGCSSPGSSYPTTVLANGSNDARVPIDARFQSSIAVDGREARGAEAVAFKCSDKPPTGECSVGSPDCAYPDALCSCSEMCPRGVERDRPAYAWRCVALHLPEGCPPTRSEGACGTEGLHCTYDDGGCCTHVMTCSEKRWKTRTTCS